MHNKANIHIVIIAVVAVMAVVVIGTAVAKNTSIGGPDGISDIPNQGGPDCDPKPIGVSITGEISVSDQSALIIPKANPKVTAISVDRVRNTNTNELLNFFDTDYDWKVELIQDGNVVASDSGTGTQEPKGAFESTTANEEQKEYYLSFTIPDNNCDDKVDNFHGKLKATVTHSRGDTSTATQNIKFVNGEFIKE